MGTSSRPLDELPTTLESSLKLLDLAPTNLGVCSHNIKLAEPEFPRLRAVLKSYCDLLPSESSLEAQNKVGIAAEVEKLKNEYDVSLQDNPLLNLWLRSHKNFTFDPFLIRLDPVTRVDHQERDTLLELFKGLPLDHLNGSLIDDFILALRQNGFENIPDELAMLIPYNWQRENSRKQGQERFSEQRDRSENNSELDYLPPDKKESQNNSKIGIY